MLKHYLEFIEKAQFEPKPLPQEATEYLTEKGTLLLTTYEQDVADIVELLYNSDCSVKATLEAREKLAEKSGVELYTVNFVFMVAASKRMKADYIAAGHSEEIFWETILDLKFKLFECKMVHNVWGNFVENWYDIFYQVAIFKLGRLEYEVCEFPEEAPVYTFGDITLKPGDKLVSIHIPSSGKLTKELREESYKMAWEFFGKKPLACFCHSWLLFEGNRQIFPATMNLVDFMNDWDIVQSYEIDDYYDAWRLFGRKYEGDVSVLPQVTSQQKAMAAWLAQGKKTGEGLGVLIYGEDEKGELRILNRK